MYPYTKFLSLTLVIALILSTLSCAESTPGSNTLVASSAIPASGSDSTPSSVDMLADVSQDVGQVTRMSSGKPRICVLEEKHTSIVGQFEIALMLLRLHDRYGLRDIALEGLTKDKAFPSSKWFAHMGGPEDAELKNEILVGMLHAGEISAVELVAMAFPDVIVHAADDPVAYRVEMTKKATTAAGVFLSKIALMSVRPEHYAHINNLMQQKKSQELRDYLLSLDPWAKDKYEQLTKDSVRSIEEVNHLLLEIEKRGTSVGAQLSVDDRTAMSEAKAFFDAAEKRTRAMVETAVGGTAPLVALNVGAAHTEGVERMLRDAKTTYAILKPLALADNLKAGDLSVPAFERKNKQLSVAFSGKGLGSLLDGRRKPPPDIGETWLQSEARLRWVTAKLARAAIEADFPSAALKQKIDALSDVKVNWGTVKKRPNGDVFFTASVLTQKGRVNVSTVCGMPNGMKSFVNRRGTKTLEQLLKEGRDGVKKEPGERKEPEKTPVIEFVTPDVSAAFSLESKALENVGITG